MMGSKEPEYNFKMNKKEMTQVVKDELNTCRFIIGLEDDNLFDQAIKYMEIVEKISKQSKFLKASNCEKIEQIRADLFQQASLIYDPNLQDDLVPSQISSVLQKSYNELEPEVTKFIHEIPDLFIDLMPNPLWVNFLICFVLLILALYTRKYRLK